MRYQILGSEFGGNLAGKSGAPARNRTGICHLGNGRSDPFELRERKFRLAYALPIFCQVASWQSEMDVERVLS